MCVCDNYTFWIQFSETLFPEEIRTVVWTTDWPMSFNILFSGYFVHTSVLSDYRSIHATRRKFVRRQQYTIHPRSCCIKCAIPTCYFLAYFTNQDKYLLALFFMHERREGRVLGDKSRDLTFCSTVPNIDTRRTKYKVRVIICIAIFSPQSVD